MEAEVAEQLPAAWVSAPDAIDADGTDRDEAEYHFELGQSYAQLGLTDDAIEEFRSAARWKELYADSCYKLGECYRQKGIPEQAIVWYRRALDELGAEDERYGEVLSKLVWANGESGNADSARRIASELSRHDRAKWRGGNLQRPPAED